MDLIDPARVADLFEGPEEDPLGAILNWFGTEKDADRRFWTWRYTVADTQHDTFGLCTRP
jgi:hypothetical protein